MATLADLQSEREALRAAQAKQDFEAALAQMCAQTDLVAAGQAVSVLLLGSILGEIDETRVHYRTSEAVHELLAGVGEQAVALPIPTNPLLEHP